MCAQVIESGTINAVAFWFDLHLDTQESLTTGVQELAQYMLSDVWDVKCDVWSATRSCFTAAAHNSSQKPPNILNEIPLKLPS